MPASLDAEIGVVVDCREHRDLDRGFGLAAEQRAVRAGRDDVAFVLRQHQPGGVDRVHPHAAAPRASVRRWRVSSIGGGAGQGGRFGAIEPLQRLARGHAWRDAEPARPAN